MEVKAFPGTPTFDQDANRTVWQEGMDLRDYFAIHASDCDILKYQMDESGYNEIRERSVARYMFADEMMEIRNGSTK